MPKVRPMICWMPCGRLSREPERNYDIIHSMAANLKTILLYFAVWIVLSESGYFLERFVWCLSHGKSVQHVFLLMLLKRATLHYWTVSLISIMVHYLLVIGISLHTLNVHAIRLPGRPTVKILFVSCVMGLIEYLLITFGHQRITGVLSYTVGLPNLVATMVAGFSLRYSLPGIQQRTLETASIDGVWPPAPRSTL